MSCPPVEAVPAAQGSWSVLSAFGLKPASTFWQASIAVWPFRGLYLPTSQGLQSSLLLATSLYVPAAQGDTLPPRPVYPAFATQSDKAAWAVAVPVPELAGQLKQLSALFADALYVPAGQGVHIP